MRGLSFGIPIRLKIVLLTAVSLSASMASYIYVGTSLIVEDKASYIYDFNFAQVRAVANAVETQIEKTVAFERMIATLIGPAPAPAAAPTPAPLTTPAPLSPPDEGPAKHLFEQTLRPLGVSALLVSRTQDSASPELLLGEGAEALRSEAVRLGWSPTSGVSPFVASASPGSLLLAVSDRDRAGRPLVLLSAIKLDPAILAGGKDFQVYLFDSAGKSFLSSGPRVNVQELARALTQGSFDSGARHWSAQGVEYIVAYRRLGLRGLTLASLIPRTAAFEAAQRLTQRSIVLGTSILLIAVALTLIFVRGLTSRLRQMWHATQRVREGDFTVRVDVSRSGNDEIAGLVTSFNAMSERISDLMAQTAKKARMEQELETAQAVQNRFFPTQTFQHERLRLAGKSVPALECGGDWWHYEQVRDHLIVAIGDVTGHGVHAALVTAAAHGAFSVLARELSEGGASPDVAQLMRRLNTAIHRSSGGKSSMSFNASVIDLRTGQMHMINASHRLPYVFRGQQFKPVSAKPVNSLGESAELPAELTPHTVTLEPGDRVLWYTDGLVECENAAGERMKITRLLKMVAEAAEAAPADPKAISEKILTRIFEFLGEAKSKALDDDITVVVGLIPPTGGFTGETIRGTLTKCK